MCKHRSRNKPTKNAKAGTVWVKKQRHDGNASIKTGRETEGTTAVTGGQSLRGEKALWIRDSYLSCEWAATAQNLACTGIVQGQGPEYPGNSHRDQDPSTNALRSKHSNVNVRTKSATFKAYRCKAMTTPTRSAVRKAPLTPPVRKEGGQSSFLETEDQEELDGNTAGGDDKRVRPQRPKEHQLQEPLSSLHVLR